jgi:5'-methylthioadenosine phosphorylase
MKEDIHPLDLVIPDQFYDQTRRRVSTFFGEGIVGHVGMADPVCPGLGDLLETAGREAGARVHRGGTYICIEGPQFSTKGESQIFRRWGVSVIGMTNMPEAKLAREAELCYATLALATDYDVWHESHAAVTVEAVVANLLKNVATAKVVLRRMIPRVGKACAAGCGDALASAVITNPKLFPPRTRRNLALLLDRYFPPTPRGRRRG